MQPLIDLSDFPPLPVSLPAQFDDQYGRRWHIDHGQPGERVPQGFYAMRDTAKGKLRLCVTHYTLLEDYKPVTPFTPPMQKVQKLQKGLKVPAAVMVSAMILSACAKSTNEIPAQYVSPMQYQSYSCQQLEAEMMAVSNRVQEIGGQVNKTASDDNAQMAIGMVLFWPALFFLDGDTPQAAEYARLKGEFDALEKAAIQKNCGLHIERPVIPAPQPANPPAKQRRK